MQVSGRRALAGMGAVLVSAVTLRAQPACGSDPGYGALDFWLGDWNVYADDRLDGTNHIEKILDGCAVVENWSDAGGSHGKSLFFYNRFTKAWKQVWIPEGGPVKEKLRVADPAPGAVRFQGRVTVGPAATVLDRTTLTPLPDHRVRQVIEISRDEGKTWRVGFDAVYVPADAGGPGPATGPPRRDRAFWRQIVENGYKVPAGESADALVMEVTDGLGSSDPERRDDFGYSIPAAWIYRQRVVSEPVRRALLKKLGTNLTAGLGETGSDTIFLRSFSALDLSILAALDAVQPFLDDAEFAGLLSAALAYLAGEKDLRAFDPKRGWMHATAHTADLLKFLGRNARLTPADQARVLDAVAAKLRDAGQVFGHGENERLAAAVQSLVLRADFDAAAFERFLADLARPGEHLWDKGPLVDEPRYAATQNAKDLLRSLYVALAPRPATPGIDQARAAILATLGKMA